MRYFTDLRSDHATLHRATCPHCRDGRGRGFPRMEDPASWAGPFVTRPEALGAARARRSVRVCGVCAP